MSNFWNGLGQFGGAMVDSYQATKQKALQIQQMQNALDAQKAELAQYTGLFQQPQAPGGIKPLQALPQAPQAPQTPGGIQPMGGGAPAPQGPPPMLGGGGGPAMQAPQVSGLTQSLPPIPQGAPQQPASPPSPLMQQAQQEDEVMRYIANQIKQQYPGIKPEQAGFILRDRMQRLQKDNPLVRAALMGQNAMNQTVYKETAKDTRQEKSISSREKLAAQKADLQERLQRERDAAAKQRVGMQQRGAMARAQLSASIREAVAQYEGDLKASLVEQGIDAKIAEQTAANQTRLMIAGANAMNPDAVVGKSAPQIKRPPSISRPVIGTQRAAPKQPTSAYRSTDDVKSAYQAGKLTRDQAAEILKNQFGVQ